MSYEQTITQMDALNVPNLLDREADSRCFRRADAGGMGKRILAAFAVAGAGSRGVKE